MNYDYVSSPNDGDILHPDKPHIPVLFLLDTSGSMHKPIKKLNSGINRLCELLSKSDYSEVIDLAVVSFSDHAELIRPFLPSKVQDEIALTASGPTFLEKGLETALHEIRERRRKYMDYNVPFYKPRIILITDACYADDLQVLEDIVKEPIKQEKISLFAIGLPGCNNSILQTLTRMVVNVDDYDLDELFDFIRNTCIDGFPGHGSLRIELPQNAHVVPYDEW